MSSTNIHPPSTKRRRPWLSFSLRGLLLLVLVLAVLCGWKMNQVNRQRRAIESIRELGGAVHFNTSPYFKDLEKQNRFEPPSWLRRLCGDDFFDYVVGVRLGGKHVDDISFIADLTMIQDLNLNGTNVSELAPLEHLTNLRKLDLMNTAVHDLSPIRNLSRLEVLSLEFAKVSDLEPLTELTNLQALSAVGTPVSDLSPLSNMTRLKELKLFYCPQVRNVEPLSGLTALGYLDLSDTQVSDVEPLSQLTGLGFLSLSRTNVSLEDSQDLRSRLPGCRIMHNPRKKNAD